MGREACGEKKITEWGRALANKGGRDDFSLPSSPIKYLVLPDEPKSEVCEVGMSASFDEKCFNFYESLYYRLARTYHL